MPRQTSPGAVVDLAMAGLERIVRKLLVDNPNFKSPDGRKQPYYFEATPRTSEFVTTTLASMADSILERVQEVRTLAVDMAADADVPGLARVHSGRIRGYDVTVTAAGGEWKATLTVPDAFHAGDDLEATFPDEGAALNAVREFARTGVPGEAFAPVPEPMPAPR